MYMYSYIYMYIYIHIYTYIYICIYVYTYILIYTCICIFICIFIHKECTCMYMCIYTFMYFYIETYKYVSTQTCVYACIYTLLIYTDRYEPKMACSPEVRRLGAQGGTCARGTGSPRKWLRYCDVHHAKESSAHTVYVRIVYVHTHAEHTCKRAEYISKIGRAYLQKSPINP